MPKIQVVPTQRFLQGEPKLAGSLGPEAALDGMIGSYEILEDLHGRLAGSEALNPIYMARAGAPDVTEPWPREPRELWALLRQLTAWRDLVPVPPIEMRLGRRWIGAIGFARQKVDLIVAGAEPDGGACLMLLAVEAVPLATGADALERIAAEVSASGEIDGAIIAALAGRDG